MITAIVLSRDRAMQLDLLLRSLPDELDPVYVICYPSDEYHRRGYIDCMTPRAAFEWQNGPLVHRALDLLNDAGLACFLTDDSVFYRQPNVPERLDDDVVCHSFRLGLNTVYCYPMATKQQVPPVMPTWLWGIAQGDFGYPGSLDGHVFRSSHLRRALRTCPAEANPNQIEDHLNRWVISRLGNSYPQMASELQSSLVGIPANRVNTTHPNRYSDSYTAEELCDRWLAGERISLERIGVEGVVGAHQEIPYVFEARP